MVVVLIQESEEYGTIDIPLVKVHDRLSEVLFNYNVHLKEWPYISDARQAAYRFSEPP